MMLKYLPKDPVNKLTILRAAGCGLRVAGCGLQVAGHIQLLPCKKVITQEN